MAVRQEVNNLESSVFVQEKSVANYYCNDIISKRQLVFLRARNDFPRFIGYPKLQSSFHRIL